MDFTPSNIGRTKEERIHARQLTHQLRGWNVALAKAQTSPVNVVVVGDSHVELGSFFGFSGRLTSRTSQGQANPLVRGWLPSNSIFGSWTTTGTPTQAGPAGWSIDLGIGQHAERIIACDRVQVWGLVSGTVQIDGGAPQAINIDSSLGQVWDSGAIVSGLHTIRVTSDFAGTRVWGVFLELQNNASGFRWWELGHSGWTTAQLLASEPTWDMIETLQPDLLIIASGTNDPSDGAYAADMAAWLNRARFTIPAGRTVLWFPHQAQSKPTWPNRQQIARRLAERFDVALVDFYEVAGSVAQPQDIYNLSDNVDNVHLNALGAELNAEALSTVLLDGPLPFRSVDATGTRPAAQVRLGNATVGDILLFAGNAVVPGNVLSVVDGANTGTRAVVAAQADHPACLATLNQTRELVTDTKTGSYQLVAGDRFKYLRFTAAATLTIPNDSTVNFPVGTTIYAAATTTGTLTIAGAGGVTVNGITTTSATAGLGFTIRKVAANTWDSLRQ